MKTLIIITSLLFVSSLFSQTAEDYYKKGLEQLNHDNIEGYNKAGEYFSKSLELDPNYYLSSYEMGKLYIRAISYDLALTEFTKVIMIAPNFSDAYIERGDIYRQSVDYKNACNDFKKAQQLGNKRAKEYLDQYCN